MNIPLPEPSAVRIAGSYFTNGDYVPAGLYGLNREPLFTVDKLHAYAAAAVVAERERCAKKLDALGCDHCAAAIRSPQPQQEKP